MTINAIVNNYLMKGDSGLRSEKSPLCNCRKEEDEVSKYRKGGR